jgi:hypothetical protein
MNTTYLLTQFVSKPSRMPIQSARKLRAGYPREGFPIQMGEIQGQVVAADINGDGYLEIVAVDTRGNVAAFDWRGRELWERHVASMISQASAEEDAGYSSFRKGVPLVTDVCFLASAYRPI